MKADVVDVGAIKRALALVGRGVFDPAQVAVLVAGAAELERRGEPYTRQENKLLDLGERLRPPVARRDPPAPTPYDTAIAEAEAALEPLRVAYDAALEALTAARRGYNAALYNGGSEAARETLRDAERVLVDADTAWLRVRARLTALQLTRDRYRIERDCFVIGRNGTPVPLAEFK